MRGVSNAGIGEKIQQETEEAAENSRQRAIRSTKEVVEREELQKREEALSRAKEEWTREKQHIFQEAHQNQLRAIARQTAILEQSLRKEFQERISQLKQESREHLERTVQDTWKEASLREEEAVAKAREEECHLAEEASIRVANRVAEEKKELWRMAEEEKASALENHTKLMEDLQRQALAEQQRKLEQHHNANSKAISEAYESRLAELTQQSEKQAAEIETLRLDLKESRDSWESKYTNLKLEFADFIDQFPGFRAEFILK